MTDDSLFLSLLVSTDGMRFQQVTMRDFGALDGESCIVGIVHPEVAKFVEAAAAYHVRANTLVNAVTLLVKDVAPPTDDRSAGVEVMSFLASGAVASMLKNFGGELRHWCYHLMKHVLDQERLVCELQIIHKPVRDSAVSVDATCDVILPHCGSETHLRLSTDSLRRQTQSCNVLIALDQDHVGAAFLADIADQNDIQAYRLIPCQVGPYVARHVFSMRSHADFIAFQDSDDISLPHRLATLAAAAERDDAGIVGSHELQVHEVQRKVYAVRYPLDVNASLQHAGANHQLLLPTSLIKRPVFERVGGFSTFRTYSLDVAFWLTASLSTKIINIDEFLYVRRRHPASLTMRPDIGTESRVRQSIVAHRRADYAAVRAGTLCVEASALAVRHRNGSIEFEDLKNGKAIYAAFEPSSVISNT